VCFLSEALPGLLAVASLITFNQSGAVVRVNAAPRRTSGLGAGVARSPGAGLAQAACIDWLPVGDV
jgi:hypothetical protein